MKVLLLQNATVYSDIIESVLTTICPTTDISELPTSLDPHIRRALILPPPFTTDSLRAVSSRSDSAPPRRPSTCSRSRRRAPPSHAEDLSTWTSLASERSHLTSVNDSLGGPRAIGTGRGAMHLLRNMPAVVIANALAEQTLHRQLVDMAVERNKRLKQSVRARSAFVDRLKMKGGPLGQLAEDIDRGKRSHRRAQSATVTKGTKKSHKHRRRKRSLYFYGESYVHPKTISSLEANFYCYATGLCNE